jgi:predicted phage tail protein
MRNIILHGKLKKEFGESFSLNVSTVGEAIRAIGSQIPNFVEEIKKGTWYIVRGDPKTGLYLGEEDVNTFNLGSADLHILPKLKGAKNGGGALKAVLGVALIGMAFFFSGGALAAPIMAGGGLLGGMTWGNIAMMGVAMAVTGVSQLLSPEEVASDKQDSFSFSGPGNVYDQGAPVPLVYGRVITGSVMVSGGIDIENIGSYQG